ncbi:MAG: penicillin amidase, partial [Parvicella sp.]
MREPCQWNGSFATDSISYYLEGSLTQNDKPMLKKILLSLLGLVLLIVISSYFFIQSQKPTYTGELPLSGASEEVKVYFDDFGIPHIYAQSEEDAYRALGYVHAQDRLFQMEVIRRIAPGRLSEIFGPDLLSTDKFFRTLGINEYSKKSVQTFNKTADDKIKSAVDAYLSGVNAFIADGSTPIEFTILGIEKSPFTLLDINNAIGYMGFSFAAAQRIEPILTKIASALGPEYLDALDLGMNGKTVGIKNYSEINAEVKLSSYVSDIFKNIPAPAWIGSNSWVLGSEKTKSGKVILENDPHVAFSQPAVWYEAHLEAPGFNIYGCHIAGVPFPAFGHSRKFATGLTMFCNDDIDFFQEKISPQDSNIYQYKGEWNSFEIREETISVKGQENVTFIVRNSIHGPIINDVLELGNEPISMYWTFTQTEGPILETLYDFSHIKSMAHARQAAEKIHAPGLNVMYGDAEGNIAWWASAKMIDRPDTANAALIDDGSSGAFDPLGFHDFTENPKAENPPWNYVYSTNNQTRRTSGELYPGHYAAEDRGRRVVSMIESKKIMDASDVKSMAVDITSENAPEV